MKQQTGSASFLEFLATYARHWFSAASGGLSVPFAVLALYVSSLRLKMLWGILAYAATILASYSVWSKAKREASKSLATTIITDQHAIYEEVARFACTAQHSIKILVYATKPPAPEWFALRMASYLASHRAVVMDVVLAVDLRAISAKFWEAQTARRGIYANLGVHGQVRLFVFDTNKPVGFDIFVVDEKHVAIGFSPVPQPGERNKEFALKFEDDPRVAVQVKAWYDNALLISKVATPMTEAYSKWRIAHP